MSTPDFTVATPPPGAGAAALLGAGLNTQDAAYTRMDLGHSEDVLNRKFTERTVPQLQSSIGAAGQWYSTARRKQEGFAGQDFKEANYSLESAAQRHLADLSRQQAYTSVGLML